LLPGLRKHPNLARVTRHVPQQGLRTPFQKKCRNCEFRTVGCWRFHRAPDGVAGGERCPLRSPGTTSSCSSVAVPAPTEERPDQGSSTARPPSATRPAGRGRGSLGARPRRAERASLPAARDRAKVASNGSSPNGHPINVVMRFASAPGCGSRGLASSCPPTTRTSSCARSRRPQPPLPASRKATPSGEEYALTGRQLTGTRCQRCVGNDNRAVRTGLVP
jgi:hypothetical protein